MRKHILMFLAAITASLAFVACDENEDEYDPYTNWQERNEAWFLSITDSARTAIAEAQALYGDAWEEHCEWRRYKSLLRDQAYDSGLYTDSICVRIIDNGTGTYSPTFSDTVRINYRGWLMPAVYKRYNSQNVEVDSLLQEVFGQTYYGEFNAETAAPSLMAVSSTIEGFSTALQYMVAGDDWMVYMPQELGYGTSSSSSVPAYSTLQFRIHLVAVYASNSGVPDWKVQRK